MQSECAIWSLVVPCVNECVLLSHVLFLFQQARAEQEEEFISNTLLKKIQALKKEKETLAHHYEQEEECLTNDLSRKLNQVWSMHTEIVCETKMLTS